MTLLGTTLLVVGVVVAMLVVGLVVVLGPERLVAARGRLPERVRAGAPWVALVGGVLAVNAVVRDVGPEVSWVVGVNVTGAIYALEGTVVADVQAAVPPAATPYFAFAYVFGYAFLLSFPPLVLTVAGDRAALRETCVAYVLNYVVGLACYLAFVAYGPRNLLPDLVDPLLYTSWPASHLLTSQVNANTNVFPSLHTSLSVTVALLAYRTRERYPRWLPPAAVLAASVVVATMYLGIHWLTDVVAGAALGVLAVRAAGRVDADALDAVRERLARYRPGGSGDGARGPPDADRSD